MMRANFKSSFSLNLFSFSFISFLIPSLTLAATQNWQGPYVGAYLGGALADTHTSTQAGTVGSTSYFSTTADINAVNQAGTSANHPTNAIGGIQAGHDWVYKKALYGVIVDYGALPLNTSKSINQQTFPDNSNQYSVYTAISSNWLFTLRARLGYQTQLYYPSLFYLTGGMAMTQLTVKNNYTDNSSYSGIGGNTTSQNQIGWTAGAGIELASLGHASLYLEYLYVGMPSIETHRSISNSVGGFGVPENSLSNSFSTTGQFRTNLLKLGINYRFSE